VIEGANLLGRGGIHRFYQGLEFFLRNRDFSSGEYSLPASIGGKGRLGSGKRGGRIFYLKSSAEAIATNNSGVNVGGRFDACSRGAPEGLKGRSLPRRNCSGSGLKPISTRREASEGLCGRAVARGKLN